MDDLGTHVAILQLIIGYTLVGAFVFTVVVTCLSLVGLVKFTNSGQQQALFGALIFELVVIAVAFFSDLIILEPGRAVAEVTAPIEQAREEAVAERDAAVATLEAVFERVDAVPGATAAQAEQPADGTALRELIADLDELRPAQLGTTADGEMAGETGQ